MPDANPAAAAADLGAPLGTYRHPARLAALGMAAWSIPVLFCLLVPLKGIDRYAHWDFNAVVALTALIGIWRGWPHLRRLTDRIAVFEGGLIRSGIGRRDVLRWEQVAEFAETVEPVGQSGNTRIALRLAGDDKRVIAVKRTVVGAPILNRFGPALALNPWELLEAVGRGLRPHFARRLTAAYDAEGFARIDDLDIDAEDGITLLGDYRWAAVLNWDDMRGIAGDGATVTFLTAEPQTPISWVAPTPTAMFLARTVLEHARREALPQLAGASLPEHLQASLKQLISRQAQAASPAA